MEQHETERMSKPERDALTRAKRRCRGKSTPARKSFLRGMTRRYDSRAFRREINKLIEGDR